MSFSLGSASPLSERMGPADACDRHFDLIVGTSTGGLLAMIFGRLRLSIAKARDLYRRLGQDIFGPRARRNILYQLLNGHKLTDTGLVKILTDVVGDMPMLDDRHDACKVGSLPSYRPDVVPEAGAGLRHLYSALLVDDASHSNLSTELEIGSFTRMAGQRGCTSNNGRLYLCASAPHAFETLS